ILRLQAALNQQAISVNTGRETIQNAEQNLRDKETEISRLETILHRLRSDADSEIKEAAEAKAKSDKEVGRLQSECSNLESEMVQSLGGKSVSSGGRDGLSSETTSTIGLKGEFKKMKRDTRAENLKALKVIPRFPLRKPPLTLFAQAEQEERRKLEALVRSLKK